MKVTIKDLSVEMEVKNKGVEFKIRRPKDDKQLGDLVISKSGLTWCKGKTTPKNGNKVTWEKFIKWVEGL